MTFSYKRRQNIMLRINHIPVLLLIVGLAGCTGTDAAEQADRYTEIIATVTENNHELRNENEELTREVARKEENIREATKLINSIMDGLATIAKQEGLVREVMTDVGSELNRERADTQEIKNIEAQMNRYITAIDEHIQENKGRLRELQETVRSSRADLATYKATINKLQNVVEEKEKAVAALREEVNNLVARVETLETENDTLEHIGQRLRSENKVLREAYYIVSTKDDLEEKNIVEKKFLRPTRLKELDPRYFTPIDIQVQEIPLPEERDRAKVFSIHKRKPHLYEIQDEKLVIKQPREFWSVSRYLIVEIDR